VDDVHKDTSGELRSRSMSDDADGTAIHFAVCIIAVGCIHTYAASSS
jgi:hypothetical protein